MKKTIFLFLSLCPLFSSIATEYMPWFSNDFEIETRLTYLFQNYGSVDAPKHNKQYSSNDHFLTVGGEISFDGSLLALMDIPDIPPIDLQLELTLAATRHRSFGFDNIRFTGRYLLLDDVAALDPVSLSTGISVIQACTQSLKDPSSFHHGRIEGEAHIAVGKECSFRQFWNSRAWALFGVGSADFGSAWLRSNLAWEHNVWDLHQFRIFMNTLWGLGGYHLNIQHFHGYGAINHRSIDLGARYSYLLCQGELSLEYARRVYAHNFPDNANLFLISFHMPFGF